MVAEQQRLIAAGPYVTEGRDIGTVVAPNSPLKIFLTASPEARAERRAAETGQTMAEVLAAQEERDRRDSEREHGALYAADDAITIDSSEMTADQVVAEIAGLARERGLA
jgi:cytidylate kinase